MAALPGDTSDWPTNSSSLPSSSSFVSPLQPSVASPSDQIDLKSEPKSDITLSSDSSTSKAGLGTPSSLEREVDDQNARPDESRGAKMREGDEGLSLPKNNMALVMFALALTMFLGALDQTIVSTALPTMTADLGGNSSDYAWVGTAYMLASSALTPLWGRLSDIFGRKAVYYPAIGIFLLGSGLCGAAKSMKWLIACRAVQGLGGGAIMTMTQIVLGDIVTLQDRGKYGSVLGATWGIASVAGPLLGGLLTDKASWRWCFWLNLPLGGCAAAMLFFFLNLSPHRAMTFNDFLRKFDFIGITLLAGGAACLLAGFSLASDISWSDKKTIALICVGVALFALGMINETYTKRMAILPPRLMSTRTTLALFFLVVIHGLCFLALTYYLPTYYQGVFGADALMSGVQMLPVSLGGSIVSLVVGPLVSHFGTARPFIWVGMGFTCLGFGVMILMDENTSVAGQEGLPIIAGLFSGLVFQPPLIALQAAMPLKDMATTTSAFMLCRSFGSTLGVAVSGTILFTRLRTNLASIPNLPSTLASGIMAGDFKAIARIEDVSQRQEVRRALAESIKLIWVVVTPLVGVAFVASLFVRHYSLVRKYKTASTVAEEETGGVAATMVEEKVDLGGGGTTPVVEKI